MEIETKQYALRSFKNSIWVILLYSHIICIIGPHRDLPSKGIMSRIDIGWRFMYSVSDMEQPSFIDGPIMLVLYGLAVYHFS